MIMTVAILYGAGGHSEEILPLSHETAVATLAIGAIVFAVVAYDAYRVHWR